MIGDVLREKREGFEFSAKELSRRSGVSAQKIMEQERGIRDLTIDELFKVDHALDNDVIWALVELYNGEIK